MPKSTYISISSHKGKKEFRIKPSTRQAIYTSFALLVTTIVTGTLLTNHQIDLLQQEITASRKAANETKQAFEDTQKQFQRSRKDALNLQTQLTNEIVQKDLSLIEMQQTIDDALSTQDQLNHELTEKKRSLSEIDKRLDGLETLLGMQDELDPSANIYEQLDILSVNTITRNTLFTLIPNGFPMKYNRISSPFGYRTNPVTKKQTLHTGIDMTCNRGEKIFAPANGVVEATQYNKGGYGRLIRLSHSFGFKSYYAHLQKINVKTGQFINKGDLLGLCGNSGRSTGAHLHYEVRFLFRPLNPKPFLTWNQKNFDSLFSKEKHVDWKKLIAMVDGLISAPIKKLTDSKVTPTKATNLVQHQKSKAISNASDSLTTP